jgi:phosphatidylserine decarboxylase
VDGIVGEVGTLEWGRLVQAKGRDYSAAGLLDDGTGAERYASGTFITIYLSPRHYHRIHAPCGGTVSEARHVPGALMPVNQPSLLLTPELFPRNERLVAMIEGPLGHVALVAVGAFNVGRISAAFDPEWNEATGAVTNRRARLSSETRRYDPPRRVRQGDEFMAFHLGSTVVLLLEPGRVEPLSEVIPGVEVRVGQCIARSLG